MVRILSGNQKEGKNIWSVIGKQILSKSGDRAGRLFGIYFSSNQIVAFLVFYKLKLIKLDSKHFRNWDSIESNKAILLDIDPVYLLPGKSVFDSDGKKLGEVSKIDQLGYYNDFDAFYVKKKFYLPGLRIEKSKVQVLNKNIILKPNG
jgi:sporulation protein YlmC with PRC-barrel domain